MTLCNDNTNQINLNNTLLVPSFIRNGVWTLASGPGTLTITNDSIINVSGISGGVYNQLAKPMPALEHVQILVNTLLLSMNLL
ncbi:MAG: hypothetical protein IPH36_02870 [Saprospiraceae bacterium]|nr:hypothetical protein [Saprospiraceae bacterium]